MFCELNYSRGKMWMKWRLNFKKTHVLSFSLSIYINKLTCSRDGWQWLGVGVAVLCLCMFYIQHLTMLRGSSPPALQQPWRWLAQCPPAGAWSHSWVTAAPCTRVPAGELQGSTTAFSNELLITFTNVQDYTFGQVNSGCISGFLNVWLNNSPITNILRCLI